MEEETFKKEYIVSDESTLNRYGSRVMTDGIRISSYLKSPTVRFQHIAGHSMLPIGKASELYKKDGKLYATLELSGHTEFEKTIIAKIKAGQMNACSIGFIPLKTSNEIALLLEGQTMETVTECDLLEISITDVPANPNTVGLSLIPNLFNNQKNTSTMDLKKAFASALGLSADATDAEILAKLKEQQERQQEAELQKEILSVYKELPHVEHWVKLAKQDKEGTFALLALTYTKGTASRTANNATKDNKVDYATKTPPTVVAPVSLAAVIEQMQGAASTELSFDYLQKNDPKKLLQIKQTQPSLYAQLVKEYTAKK